MSAEKPWEAGPFSGWVIEELNKRVSGISKGIDQTFTNDSITYKSGPRRHWIRAFSSGFVEGIDNNSNWGLILKSPDSSYNITTLDIFSARYGISQQQVYGYFNDETPKLIPSNQNRINVPEPGITSFTADVQKNFFITAKLNWICHSIDQLNAITPYFLTPLTTVFVEWGWNIFNRESLLDYTNESKLKEIIENHFLHYQEGVPKSKGNYEFMVGEITNFEYSIEENIIRGFTEIRSRQMSWSGFHIGGAKNVTSMTSQQQSSVSPALDFKTVCKQIITGLQAKSENIDPKSRPPGQIQGRVGAKLSEEDKSGITALLNILQTIKTKDNKNKYGDNGVDVSKYIYKFINTGEKQSAGTQNNLMDTYITFELIADIMNALKDQHSNDKSLKNYATVDVDTDVGYHENLISTSRNVLIPNTKSPKFNGKGSSPYILYSDDETKFIDDTDDLNIPYDNSILESFRTAKSKRERGQDSQNISIIQESTGFYSVNEPGKGPNSTLTLLVGYKGRKIYRNNLDYVLNKYGRTKFRESSGFGFDGTISTRTDEYLMRNPNAKINTPNIKNVYINLSFIKDSIVNNDDVIDMENMYNILLKELNDSVCDFWNLELINVDTDGASKSSNRLKVVDRKRININIPPGYMFEYGNSNSIIKKINFTTTLTNAQANQILYRSFGNKSLSTNNMIDFTNDGKYRDKLKSNDKTKNRTMPSETMLTFQNVISKYLKYDTSNPSGNFMMRLKVYGTKTVETPAGRARKASSSTVIDDKKYNIVDLYIPDKEALVFLLNDNDREKNTNIYCAPIRNVEIEISLMGIAGIRVFEYFKIKNLPPPFTENVVVFQVRDVNHTLDESGWETRIKASLRPSYNIKL